MLIAEMPFNTVGKGLHVKLILNGVNDLLIMALKNEELEAQQSCFAVVVVSLLSWHKLNAQSCFFH